MRRLSALVIVLSLAAFGCSQPSPPATEAAATPAPAMAGAGAAGADMQGSADQPASLTRPVNLDPAVRAAWSGVKIKVVDKTTGKEEVYSVPLDTPTPLGETGLVMVAEAFVPDFEMGPDGITSRSPDPNNPAAAVRITEDGKPDYTGWLFGAMPEIHPFPHERYQVLLEAGIPAKSAE